MSSSSSCSSPAKPTDQLSSEQLAKIERNRQRALLIRQQKQQNLSTNQLFSLEAKTRIIGTTSGHDSGGGFLIDDEDLEDLKAKNDQILDKDSDICFGESVECLECKLEFNKSFLLNRFSHKICDNCKDLKDKHSLITRTEAKIEYLLKDCDLDKREPSLRFISKKNPHQFARGDMRLYLRSQVEDRALEVWGTEEALEDERDRRSTVRQKRKQKSYEKTVKSLRMSVRSSLYTKQTKSHCHQFDEEVYNEEEDMYEKTCKTCGYCDKYEKM